MKTKWHFVLSNVKAQSRKYDQNPNQIAERVISSEQWKNFRNTDLEIR